MIYRSLSNTSNSLRKKWFKLNLKNVHYLNTHKLLFGEKVFTTEYLWLLTNFLST